MAKKSPACPRSSFRFTSAPRQRQRNLLHPPPNPPGLPQQTSCHARRNKLGCPSTLPSSTMPVYRYCSFLWPPAYSTPASSPSRHSLLIPEWFAHNVPIGVSLSFSSTLHPVHPCAEPTRVLVMAYSDFLLLQRFHTNTYATVDYSYLPVHIPHPDLASELLAAHMLL